VQVLAWRGILLHGVGQSLQAARAGVARSAYPLNHRLCILHYARGTRERWTSGPGPTPSAGSREMLALAPVRCKSTSK
jgi:hypothetical protein